ncbi:ATP-binding protein [Rubinisphaera margarita]|uniref:ATP-binding protein n=1 Tax=Rubinisphaera margarita TaxID=2909586 RepID=UPI001EE9059D|nr:ATP-binding protein [Rubinisphaera margarita]MCG6155893.1 ATP-binding protein [Rubinisphaera margarita]
MSIADYCRIPDWSVRSKITFGFSVVLVLHISIACLSHYGMCRAQQDWTEHETIRREGEMFNDIDLLLRSLQREVLLFAFTGYEGPEHRAIDIQNEIESKLTQAMETNSHSDSEALAQMMIHLSTHQELFNSVIVDRARRKHLLLTRLPECEERIRQKLDTLRVATTQQTMISRIDTAFANAQLQTMRYIHSPDSSMVRATTAQLEESRDMLNGMIISSAVSETAVEEARQALDEYESVMLQMVQATRGYLHLVNVVLAGELVEFGRFTNEVRSEQAAQIGVLAAEMANATEKFKWSSNLFSVITIVMGLAASWLITRDIVPPLNNLTSTFSALARGESRALIPAGGRNDELGSLSKAALVFNQKAAETRALLQESQEARDKLDDLNRQLNAKSEDAERLAQQATAATQAKSDFLANMSHEIRTPMTAIIGYSEILAEQSADQSQTSALTAIRRNAMHLLTVINDILDLSKVEAGKLDLDIGKHNPSLFIQDAVELIRGQAEAKNLAVIVEFDGTFPESIETDPTRLRQILINLLSNAIKFTASGSIRIRATLSRQPESNWLCVDVADTGIGMSLAEVGELFQPFSQADSSTTRRFGGTGLGLTVSRKLAEILGGSLELVETQKGVGSRFQLKIPVGDLSRVPLNVVSNTHLSENSEQKKEDLRGYRVLLVEDGPDNQQLISFILRKVEAEVEIVSDGLAAIRSVMSAPKPFDCILMDMQMPVMSGYEAVRLLREKSYDGRIIALTANAMAGEEQKCREAGCDEFATKPIDRKVLVQMIRRLVAKAAVDWN